MLTIKRTLLPFFLFFPGIVVLGQVLPRVTLEERGATLEKLLNDIQRETGYVFWADSVNLSKGRPVTFSWKGACS